MASVVVAIPKPGKMKGKGMKEEMSLDDEMPMDYEDDEEMAEFDDLDGLEDMEDEEDDLAPANYDDEDGSDVEIEMATAVIDSLKSKDPAAVARALKDFVRCCGGEMES